MAIWTKSFLFSFLFLVASFSPPKGFTETFQKLPSAYTISYGDPQAPIHVVEYFSFSCPQCLALLKKEFPHVQEKYINPGKVYWSFHPDPADLLTLQAMICLETLSQGDKQLLLEETARHLKPHSLGKGCFLLQEIMKGLGKPLPELYDLKWIEKTQAFQKAYTYLSQKQVPSDLPTVEINGILYENFPTLSFLSRQLSHPAHQGEKK